MRVYIVNISRALPNITFCAAINQIAIKPHVGYVIINMKQIIQ